MQRIGRGLAANFPPETTQISAASNYPGIIKAFHIHKHQTDCWTPAAGLLQVVLIDLRPESSTFGARNTLYVGALRPWQILIPPGVAHGYKVIALAPSVLVYATDRFYNPADEGRIHYNDPAPELRLGTTAQVSADRSRCNAADPCFFRRAAPVCDGAVGSAGAKEFPGRHVYAAVGSAISTAGRRPCESAARTWEPYGTVQRRWWLWGMRAGDPAKPALSCSTGRISGGTLYMGTTPAVLTIHDLSPWRDPAWHPDLQENAGRVRKRTPWLVRLGRALPHPDGEREGGAPGSDQPLRDCGGEGAGDDPGRIAHDFRYIAADCSPGTGAARFSCSSVLWNRARMCRRCWKRLAGNAREATGADLVVAGRKRRADFAGIAPVRRDCTCMGEVPDEQLPAPVFAGAGVPCTSHALRRGSGYCRCSKRCSAGAR